MSDIVFRLDAGPGVGFGHAARCLILARALQTRGFTCTIEGDIAAHAATTMAAISPDTAVCPTGHTQHCDLVVFDLMVDPEEPDAVNDAELERWHAIAKRMVVIHSGLTVPELHVPALVIGYQPSQPDQHGPDLYWGLEYAPVDRTALLPVDGTAQPGRCLLALGGAPDWSAHERILALLAADAGVQHVDVLASPATPGVASFERTPDISVHRNVPSVGPLIAQAQFVIASFGNLCFEALALGKPLIVVGGKRFQVRYGELLAERGLAMSAGLLDAHVASRLAHALAQLPLRAGALARQAGAAIDFHGLERIADIIEHQVRRR